jgi:UDP-N-acetylglucosamine--N-acetylmuramyl-(pentapeptide) pyrophosphoryl-undecaprenol N-acetylglucosamine transferase
VSRTVLVAGGGTGGHLYPGLAVAEALRALAPDVELVFVGTERGIEARVIPPLGYRLHLVDVRPMKRMGLVGTLRGALSVPASLAAMWRILGAERPALVIGVGGYASGPAIVAAALRRIPAVLLEQNAIPGLTNRLSAPFVRRAYVTFPESARFFGGAKTRTFGNPVRVAFAATASPPPARGSILIFGGSQGARALNRVVPDAMKLVPPDRPVVHQTGRAEEAEVRARYQALGVAAEVRPFIDDMAGALEGAALVICRAGATTLAELQAMGRPSILVPLPTAADDHQTANAASLERAGACVLLPERDLTPEHLAALVRELLADDPRRRRMAEAAQTLARPAAAREIASDLVSLIGDGLHEPTNWLATDPRPHPEGAHV